MCIFIVFYISLYIHIYIFTYIHIYLYILVHIWSISIIGRVKCICRYVVNSEMYLQIVFRSWHYFGENCNLCYHWGCAPKTDIFLSKHKGGPGQVPLCALTEICVLWAPKHTYFCQSTSGDLARSPFVLWQKYVGYPLNKCTALCHHWGSRLHRWATALFLWPPPSPQLLALVCTFLEFYSPMWLVLLLRCAERSELIE